MSIQLTYQRLSGREIGVASGEDTSELLDCGLLVGPLEVRFDMVRVRLDDVRLIAMPAAGHRDVKLFAARGFGIDERVGGLDRRALRAVCRRRVAEVL